MMFLFTPRLGDDVGIDPRLTTSSSLRPQMINTTSPASTSTELQPVDPYAEPTPEVPYPDVPPPAAVTPTSVSPAKCGWLCWALIAVGVVTISGLAYYTFRRK